MNHAAESHDVIATAFRAESEDTIQTPDRVHNTRRSSCNSLRTIVATADFPAPNILRPFFARKGVPSYRVMLYLPPGHVAPLAFTAFLCFLKGPSGAELVSSTQILGSPSTCECQLEMSVMNPCHQLCWYGRQSWLKTGPAGCVQLRPGQKGHVGQIIVPYSRRLPGEYWIPPCLLLP